MSYQTAITIAKAIKEIRKQNYVLPSIQREFVWKTDQIERLFDSLMREYPIGTFLFWKVDKNNIQSFQFYEFLTSYHERNNTLNKKADLYGQEEVIAILDGQQRLTSLLIGLRGTYASKVPYKRKDNPDSYPKRKLFLNILRKAEDIEMEYDFRFLKEEDVVNDSNHFWFEVSNILDIENPGDLMHLIIEHGLTDTSKYDKAISKFAVDTLNLLHSIIHTKGLISYYLEESAELDKVLQIFIRINSGGTKLSYSDLLLSIATAKWEEKDAREVIHEYVQNINRIGQGFSFSKDLVLKTCLVLSDFKDIKFKVDNFNKQNMLIVEQNWEDISRSLYTTIQLISSFGYSEDSLSTTNALIPIAYYIHKNKVHDKIIHSDSLSEQRDSIKQWLARVILKGTFGGTPDGIYPVMRNIINKHIGDFPLEVIIEHYRGKRKSIAFDNDDLDNILGLQYNKPRTFATLSLLYPALDSSFKYDQDHIHPQYSFTFRRLKERGIPEERIEDYLNKYNTLPNLQLLESQSNKEKNKTPLKDWIDKKYPSEDKKIHYCQLHHIPTNTSFALEDFLTFYEQRRLNLKKELSSILNIKTETEQ